MTVPRGTPDEGQITEITAQYYCPFCNPLAVPDGGKFQVGVDGDDPTDLSSPVLLHSAPPCERFMANEPFDKTLRAARLAGLREVISA